MLKYLGVKCYDVFKLFQMVKHIHIWIGKAQLAKILAARVDHCTNFSNYLYKI